MTPLLGVQFSQSIQIEDKAKVGPVTVIALAGMVKTGSAFTLIDPSHPKERMHTIVSHVSKRLVISSAINADLAARLGWAPAGCARLRHHHAIRSPVYLNL